MLVALAISGASQQATAASTDSWQPYDLSVLFPLDSKTAIDKSGLCNLPKLSQATLERRAMLPRAMFNRIVDEAFGLESYVKAPPYTRTKTKLTRGATSPIEKIKAMQFGKKVEPIKGKLERKKQLAAIRAKFASGDYPAPLFCGRSGHSVSKIEQVSDTIALESGAHLAQLRRLSADICDYDNWRVTAVRFDLCLEQPEIKDFFGKSNSLPAECLTQEFRVTLKPVYSSAGRVTMENFAIKLIYHLQPGRDAVLIEDLRSLRAATQKAIAHDHSEGKGDDQKQQGAALSLGYLMPHPGLKAEMASCNGSVAGRVKSLLQNHALAKTLVSAQYSGMNRDLDRISVGVVPLMDTRPGAEDELDRVNSFSLRNFAQQVDQLPYSPNGKKTANNVMESFAKPFRHAGKKISDDMTLSVGRDLVARGNRVTNPLLVSQYPTKASLHGTDCLSCHMTKAAQDMVRSSAADSDHVESHAFRYYSKTGKILKPWPELKAKEAGHTDNFGYFYSPRAQSLTYKISQRTINETHNQSRVISKFFPPAAPK